MVDTLLEATARVLRRDGYAKTSTNRIAKAAGVSVGSLYQYFPNKDALILAVARNHSQKMIGLLERHVLELARSPIEEAVRTYVSAMLQAHSLDPELHRVLAEQVLSAGLEQIRELNARARFVVRAYLELHKDEILPRNLDMAAYVLVVTVESVTHALILDEPERLRDPELEEEMCAMILRYLLGATPTA